MEGRPAIKRRKQKTTLQLQRAEADHLWQRAVMKRDGNRCQYPGCNQGAHEAHHIIHKGGGRFSVRWRMDNGISLCREHHLYDSHPENKAKLRQACLQFVGDHVKLQNLVLIANTEPGPHVEDVIAELRFYLGEG